MSSREKILASIRGAKGAEQPLPAWEPVRLQVDDLCTSFTDVLRSIGGQVIPVSGIDEVKERLQAFLHSTAYYNGSRRLTMPMGVDLATTSDQELAAIPTVILDGSFGVAENGAIWLPESAMGRRILPFSCESLMLLLSRQDLVADMHQAAERATLAGEGYGVYIAGPSKTADIEQSLVIGAHGPLGLTVFLLP